MLSELKIQNLAILPELHVSFSQGFNVLTGETGAGKSILIDAIGLLAGQRASSDVVRAGERTAIVEGVLKVGRGTTLRRVLEAKGVQVDEGEVVVRRIIQADGRSKIWVNDLQWTVSGLSELSAYWLDMNSQHVQQSLLDESTHVFFLDLFAQSGDLRQEYQDALAVVRSIDREIEVKRNEREDAAKQRDFLQFQFQELKEAGLRTGEEEELQTLHRRLAHREKLARASLGAQDAIHGDDSGEGGIVSRLSQVRMALEEASKLDSTLTPCLEELSDLENRLVEIGERVARYGQRLDFDEVETEKIDERLALLQKISRKYGSPEKAIEERDRIERILGSLEDAGTEEKELQAKRNKAMADLRKKSDRLSEKRKQAAKIFSKDVTTELNYIGMPSAHFAVRSVAPDPSSESIADGSKCFGSFGAEVILFELAPNPGEGFRALVKIASGGELSRILLAMKGIALRNEISADVTYLFDEVDTGIGGETAERVGIRMHELSKGRQVLCVTHLGQIACYADVHIRIEKVVSKGRTVGKVTVLPEKDRANELARMVGGVKVTSKAKEYATELLHRRKNARPGLHR